MALKSIEQEKTIMQMVREIPLGHSITCKPYDFESVLLAMEPLERIRSRRVQACLSEIKYKWNNFYDSERAY